jgi:hypothetical protein|tara:strand:- start:2309 stop:2557 length:249 start_codon:yes stop_codon:yes gene_type:complete
MFLLPERAQPAPQVHKLPVESRQLSGALRFGSQSGHVGRSAELLGSTDSESLVSLDTEVHQVEYNSRRTRGAELYTDDGVRM